MKLTSDETNKLLRFLGYGCPSGPVWFVGLEEGLGSQSDKDSQQNLKARGQFNCIMDLRAAHLQLVACDKPIDIETQKFKRFPPVWIWMARIMRAFNGEENSEDTEFAKQYARQNLGREHGDTFLTELSPIPRSHLGDTRWRESFAGSAEYRSEIMRERWEKLRQLEIENKPDKIICYSASRKARKQMTELFSIGSWNEPFPKVAVSNDNRYLMLPFFGRGMTFETYRKLLSLGLLPQRKMGT